jgi:acyl-CoA thioesterase FadM
VLAAAFDELLGMTQSLSGQPGMTGTLTVRYRRPTPLHHDLRFEGTLERVEGRKIFTRGRCFAGETLTAEAEGLFVRVDFQKLAEMMTKREQPPA